MGLKEKMKKRLGMKPKRRRNIKKEKRRKGIFGFLPSCTCNPTLILVAVVLIGIMWINAGAPNPAEIVDDAGDWVNPYEDLIDEDDIYYQLGLEFPVQPEDIDVLLTVSFYQIDGETWIEDIDLAPIGLSVSVNDYKPGDTFFLDMFYGDADYNITMSGVITVNEAIQMTVYICNVAAVELLDITWIEDGSGVRWDYL